MALWMVRTGRHGQHEQHFLESSRIYLCWDGLRRDLTELADRESLASILRDVYPASVEARIVHHARQISAFHSRMKPGDWVVVPSKRRPAIHVGEIVGEYAYDDDANDPCYHHREVRWIGQDIPRSNFDQDLLYSFGAFMTICQIKRNDAERRVRAMGDAEWRSSLRAVLVPSIGLGLGDEDDETVQPAPDLEQIGRDQIAKLVLSRFKGHGMARLVDAILQAQGYITHLSPEGPDKGVDLLAAPGPMGFGRPRICVQVKSGDEPIDRPTLDQLVGTMQNVQAEHGLFVSWGGFRSTVDRERAVQFFRVRLWDQNDLIENLLEHYERLDEEIRAELPLKRVWTVATPRDAD